MRVRSLVSAATAAILLAALAVPVSATAPATPATGHWSPIGPTTPALISETYLGQVEGGSTGPDGKFYFYGMFFNAGGDPTADFLAVYDPATGFVRGLGSNGNGGGALNGQVKDIAWYNGILYVAGSFTNAAGIVGVNYIAAWNGTAWSGRGAFDGAMNSLAVADGRLYAAGNSTNIGGNALADYLGVYDGYAWAALGSNGSGNGAIGAIVDKVVALPDGRVFLGGAFNDAGANTAADDAAWWDPASSTWKSIGGSPSGTLSGEVLSLAVSGSRVVLVGTFLNANGDPAADRVVEWTGTAWKHLGTDLTGTDGAVPYLLTDVALYGSNVIVTGIVHGVAGNAAIEGVAVWNGAKWMPLAVPGPLATMFRVQVVGRTLYVSGMAHDIGGITSADGIAAFGLPAPPSAPRSLVGTAGSKKVTVSWAAPATVNGGGPVRDYVVQVRKKGTTTWKTVADGVRTTRSAVVTGLVKGVTYEIRVAAKNDWGIGSYSAVSAKRAG
jgi:hypothetical protein